MGKVYERIDDAVRQFIARQHVFFVATAPLSGAGHVNLSPKGLAGTFQVLDDHTVGYVDLTASGAETIAHLRENGRITVMFCSFDRSPKVLRLHGRGQAVPVGTPAYDEWRPRFPQPASVADRAVILIAVERVSDSCGYALPVFDEVTDRDLLTPVMERRGAVGVAAYRREKNSRSLDGLPAYPT